MRKMLLAVSGLVVVIGAILIACGYFRPSISHAAADSRPPAIEAIPMSTPMVSVHFEPGMEVAEQYARTLAWPKRQLHPGAPFLRAQENGFTKVADFNHEEVRVNFREGIFEGIPEPLVMVAALDDDTGVWLIGWTWISFVEEAH